MTPVDTGRLRVTRLLRVVGGALLAAALTVWVAPVTASGQNLVPLGCGSPASPVAEPLTDFVCRDHVDGARSIALALLVAGVVLLALGELVLPRLREHPWLRAVAAAAVVAVPAIALAVTSLFSVIARQGADGTLIRCGSAFSPAMDEISTRLCGQLPERRRTLSLATVGLSMVALAGAGYVARGVGDAGLAARDGGAPDVTTPSDAPDATSPSDALTTDITHDGQQAGA